MVSGIVSDDVACHVYARKNARAPLLLERCHVYRIELRSSALMFLCCLLEHTVFGLSSSPSH
jgi:hypothetical protein